MKHFYRSCVRVTKYSKCMGSPCRAWHHDPSNSSDGSPVFVQNFYFCWCTMIRVISNHWPDPDQIIWTHPICLHYTAYLLMPKWEAVRSYGLVWTTTAQNCHKSFQNIKHCTIVLTIVQERSFGIFTSVSVFSSTSHYPFTSATVGISVHICNEEL